MQQEKKKLRNHHKTNPTTPVHTCICLFVCFVSLLQCHRRQQKGNFCCVGLWGVNQSPIYVYIHCSKYMICYLISPSLQNKPQAGQLSRGCSPSMNTKGQSLKMQKGLDDGTGMLKESPSLTAATKAHFLQLISTNQLPCERSYSPKHPAVPVHGCQVVP